ncbi:biotin synthase BioB [Larsenimonas rhizosphaerae]|uniref:Biotin synthase n=1 Tax=Larsenimonas rhizosphaerae TaxID=2944682 RepID=A0AA42CWZ2_9GAMM|nr:biotin synthase BioB [Larsenimonas rhizosphaerae]MCM2130549.1 biotin synthase BioB [Larsenimonas rhizosphaerae]MCX2523253.1 biotin synthase BioB [Larsenimonas rhizosphaerae]
MTALRHDWSRNEISALLALPFNDLLFQAQTVHRHYFDPNAIQVSMLLSIKTGACPEDCKYCPQSGHYATGLEKEKLLEIDRVEADAKQAMAAGAGRFCMGAAWKAPTQKDFPAVLEMVRRVKALGLDTCMTLGTLTPEQAQALSDAGLDYYNHNLDTSPEYYGEIITTRTYADRLETLDNVRQAGMKVCCGGILGMGESENDRVGLLQQLANLPTHPESVPINMLIRIKGTPLENVEELDPIDYIRTIAVARLLMPSSYVRLAAGRENMSEEMQALAFMAGANSIFYGDRLLTAANPGINKDTVLFEKLGLHPEHRHGVSDEAHQIAIDDALHHQRLETLAHNVAV